MYRPRHFAPQEFVPPSVYKVRGEKSLQLMDERVLITADQLREYYGPMVVNNWHFWKPDSAHWSGDLRKWSGLRVKGCPYGTVYSQHRFGRALDAVFRDVTAEEVRKDVLDHPDWFPYITSLETGVSWFHFDVRNCKRIMTYAP